MSTAATTPPPPSPDAGLVLVTCPSWEALRDDLGSALAEPPADPFARQWVVCSSGAARRDLSQSLSQQLGVDVDAGGICAGIGFRSMAGVRRELDERLLGQAAATDPWRSRGLAMAVLDVLDEVVDEPWAAPLHHHLGDREGRPGRRLALADRIARLFLRYVHQRPSLVRAWNQGREVGIDDAPLPQASLWQSRLWRLVRERLADQGSSDPLTRHEDLLAAVAGTAPDDLLADGERCLRLVDPLACGPLDRELVQALSDRVTVVVWLLDGPGPVRLASAERWREAATRERTATGPVVDEPAFAFHASHGPDRQVEVLREVLCALFEEDPTLEPRDVVVACPDLDSFAPLVRAAFCLDDEAIGAHLHPGHRLRVQVAASSLAQPNHVLDVLGRVLHLASDRATAQDLVDLCASEPVRRRLGLGTDDLDRITRLVGQADVRWGLDASHRASFGMGQVRQSTWLAGVERILVGVAMGTTPLHWVGTALPVDQVDSSDVVAAGALAELVSRIRKLVWQWSTPVPVGGWTTRLHEALDLLCATGQEDAWMLAAAHAELADLADLTANRTALLGLADVRTLFERMLRPTSGRPGFGNGSLLVCRLEDLGSVPHRVVAVLGLDDQRFPARPALDGDDITSWERRDVEVNPRALSRQALDDAVASARDLVVVVHQGATPRTNQRLPEPVAVVELQERAARSGPLAAVQHPLQPQSAANFTAAAGGKPFSFDERALRGASARRSLLQDPGTPGIPLWQQELDSPVVDAAPGTGSELDLQALVDFYRHPARELLRHSLGVTMTEWDDALSGELPIETNGLAEWAIGDRMVRLQLAGMAPDQVEAAERLRGELPPGALGTRTLSRLRPQVDRVVRAAQRLLSEPPQDLDCRVAVAAVDVVGRIHVNGPVIVSHGFSRTGAPHLLQAWIPLLVLAASQPAPPIGWRAVHVGRDAIATLVAPPPAAAVKILRELVEVREAGLTRLVGLPPRTAAAFEGVVPLRPYGEQDREANARREFGHEHDPDWARFVAKDLEALRRIPRCEGDPGIPGPSRFENLSNWLFAPLRDQMSVGNLS